MRTVDRFRNVLGLVTGLLLLASAGAHAFLGWPPFRAELARLGAGADVVSGLAMGWFFSSVAMVVFGVVVLWTFAQRLRGRAVPLLPTLAIGAGYLAFGLGTAALAGWQAFLLLFLVPGALLVVAALPRGVERN